MKRVKTIHCPISENEDAYACDLEISRRINREIKTAEEEGFIVENIATSFAYNKLIIVITASKNFIGDNEDWLNFQTITLEEDE